MRRHRLLLLALVVALALGLSTQASTVTAQGKVTVTMSTWAGAGESAELQQILDKINTANTDFEIVHTPIPSDYYTQIKTQLAGNTAADLLWIDQDNMALAADGVFLPLTDCLNGAAAGSTGDVKDYYPDILGTAIQDGVVYGLPWIAQPVVTYYNKKLFDDAKLAYPTADWTWDDFLTNAKALTKDTSGDGKADQWGFIANGWPPPQIFMWQAGGEVISPDLKTSPIDSAEVLEGVDFYLQLAYNPEVSPSREVIAEQGFGELFKAGKIGMFMGGAADDLDRVEGLPVGVVAVPRHPKTKSNTTFAWTASTVVSASTKNAEMACKALLAVTEGIQSWKIVSPRISQSTVDHLVKSEPRKKDSAEAIIAAVPTMRAYRIIPKFAQWNDVFWSKFMNPILNRETDRTAAELAKEVRPLLEETLVK
jgi:multiple sugar transport system substrate-binding protein